MWAPSSLVFNAYRRSLPEVKRPRREADHSPTSSANVKNEWGLNSTALCAFMARTENTLFIVLTIYRAPILYIMDRNSVFGIVTGYGLDGSGIESRWGRDVPDRPWGPPCLPYNVYRVFPGGEAAGA